MHKYVTYTILWSNNMKKALLVGINYTGTQYPLRGCINDVMKVNEILVNNLGFDDPKQIRMLTEHSATTANILDRLNWLVDGAQPGDVLYFHYSGHGAQFIDLNYDTNDEPDGLDEVLVPYDMDWRTKIIKDDDIKRIFNKVPTGVNLTVTLDCCHSGSGLRNFIPPLELRDDLMGPTRDRVISTPIDIMNRSYGINLQPKQRALQNANIIPCEVQTGLLISGCKSNETSADAWIQPKRMFYGALTYTMFEILHSKNYQISYHDLVIELNDILPKNGFTQHPELNGKSNLFNQPFLQPFSL